MLTLETFNKLERMSAVLLDVSRYPNAPNLMAAGVGGLIGHVVPVPGGCLLWIDPGLEENTPNAAMFTELLRPIQHKLILCKIDKAKSVGDAIANDDGVKLLIRLI